MLMSLSTNEITGKDDVILNIETDSFSYKQRGKRITTNTLQFTAQRVTHKVFKESFSAGICGQDSESVNLCLQTDLH